MSGVISLIVVDDEAIVRQGLAGLLALESDLLVAGTAANGAQAVELAAKCNPEVVLMDIQMPVMDGIEATRRLLAQQPGVKVLVLTTFDDDELIVSALKSGAHGYLLKDCGGRQLAAAVRSAQHGFATLARAAVEAILTNSDEREPGVESGWSRLTSRERQVLQYLSEGLSNAEIAGLLHITEKTVRDHVSNILGELNLRDRTQAALWAKSCH